MKKVLVVGGAGGIGLAIARLYAQEEQVENVFIVDKSPLPTEHVLPKMESFQLDLNQADYSLFDRFADVDVVMITAGFGRLALFRDVSEQYVTDSVMVNQLSVMRLIHRFYSRLESPDTFRLGVMVSIAGFMSSPFFAVYGATKAALKIFIESINVELEKAGTHNRILNVSPGSIRGTGFNGGCHTDMDAVNPLAKDIIEHLEAGDDLFIPAYDQVYHEVLERYHRDFRAEGRHSYDYKQQRIASEQSQAK
ncbi:MAG: SDR family NAD(P)-dependent oxidoreductase [Bacteroidaceae bacterium]|nr:SDR family NAD(P)-dependent oxidoreductase [Bacteroidaceae bacterium]